MEDALVLVVFRCVAVVFRLVAVVLLFWLVAVVVFLETGGHLRKIPESSSDGETLNGCNVCYTQCHVDRKINIKFQIKC